MKFIANKDFRFIITLIKFKFDYLSELYTTLLNMINFSIKLSNFIGDLIGSFSHLFDVELFLELDSPDRNYFDFEKKVYKQGAREYFGLGLHLTVVPCEVHVSQKVQQVTRSSQH